MREKYKISEGLATVAWVLQPLKDVRILTVNFEVAHAYLG